MAVPQVNQLAASLGNFVSADLQTSTPGIGISGDVDFSSNTEVLLRFTSVSTTTNKVQLKTLNSNWTAEKTLAKGVDTTVSFHGLRLRVDNSDSKYQVGDIIKVNYVYNDKSYSHMDCIQRADNYDIYAYSSTGDGSVYYYANANTAGGVVKKLGRATSRTGQVVTDTHGQQMYWGFGPDPASPPMWSGYPQHVQFNKENTGEVAWENGEVDLLGAYDSLHDMCVIRHYDHYGGSNTTATLGAGQTNHWGFGIERDKKVIHIFYYRNIRQSADYTTVTERPGNWILIKTINGASSGLKSSQSITTDGRSIFILDMVGNGLIKIFTPTFTPSTSGSTQGNPWSSSGGVKQSAFTSLVSTQDFSLEAPESHVSLIGCYWSSIRINSWHDPVNTRTATNANNQTKSSTSTYTTNGIFLDDVYYDDKIWISKHRDMELNRFVCTESTIDQSLIFLGGLSNIYSTNVAIDTDAGSVKLLSYMPNLGNQSSYKLHASYDSLNTQIQNEVDFFNNQGKVGVLESYEQPFVNVNKSGVMGFVMTTGLWEQDSSSEEFPNAALGGTNDKLGALNMRRWEDGTSGTTGQDTFNLGGTFDGIDPSPNIADSFHTAQNPCVPSFAKGMMGREYNGFGDEYDTDDDSGGSSTSKVYYFYGDGLVDNSHNKTLGGNHAVSWGNHSGSTIENPFPDGIRVDGRFGNGPGYDNSSHQSTHWSFVMKNPQTQLYVVHSHRINTGNAAGAVAQQVTFCKETNLCPSGEFGQKTLQFPILEPYVKWHEAGESIVAYQSGFVSARLVDMDPESASGAQHLFVSYTKDNQSQILRSVDLQNVDFLNPLDRSIFTAGYGKVRMANHTNTTKANVNEPLLFSTGAGDDIIRGKGTDIGGGAKNSGGSPTNYYAPKDYILGSRTTGFTQGAMEEESSNFSIPEEAGTGLYNGGMFLFEVKDGHPSPSDNHMYPAQNEASNKPVTSGEGVAGADAAVVSDYSRSWFLNLQCLAYDSSSGSSAPYKIFDSLPGTIAFWDITLGTPAYSTVAAKQRVKRWSLENGSGDDGITSTYESLQLLSPNKGELNIMGMTPANYSIPILTTTKEASYQLTSEVSEDADYEWEKGEKLWYRISFLYDGFQESPLSSVMTTVTQPAATTTLPWRAKITLKLHKNATDVMNRRISHVQLYRSMGAESDIDAPEFYRLVKSVPLVSSDWTFTDPDWTKVIYDKKDMFASYEELTGMPETLQDTQIHYGVSANQSGFLFITDCWHKESGKLPNYIFRSKPGKFNIFDWSSDYAVLPERPVALAGFAGKIWAWSKSSMYRINPSNLVIEDIFEGIGCSNESSVVVTDYGMFWADENMIFKHDGSKTINIGTPIIAGDPDWSWRAKRKSYPSKLVFDFANKQLLCIFKPNSNLNTHGSYAWAYHVDRNRWDLYDFKQSLNGVSLDVDVLALDNADDGSVIFSTQGNGVQKFRGGSSRRMWQFLSKSITCDTPTLKKVFYKLRVNIKEGTVSRIYQFDNNAQSSLAILTSADTHNPLKEKFIVGGNNDPNRKATNLTFKLIGAVGAVVDSVGTIFRRQGMPK